MEFEYFPRCDNKIIPRQIGDEGDVPFCGNYEKHDNLMLAFVCRVKNAEFSLSGEVKEATWFGLEETYDAMFVGAYGRDMITEIKRLREGGLLGI